MRAGVELANLWNHKTVYHCVTMAKKKKKRTTCLSVFHIKAMRKKEKSVTILKLCKRSFKWDLAGCPSPVHLEMSLRWRLVVRNLKIHYKIFMFFLCCNIETKHFESKICSWRHFKENLKLFNLIMDHVSVTILTHIIKRNVKTKITCYHGKKTYQMPFFDEGFLINYKR